MTRIEIEQTLIDLLKELQDVTGDSSCNVTTTTMPLRDLAFFDSLLALETTVTLEEKLGASWDQDSVFVDKESAVALTVSEIAQKLATASGIAA